MDFFLLVHFSDFIWNYLWKRMLNNSPIWRVQIWDVYQMMLWSQVITVHKLYYWYNFHYPQTFLLLPEINESIFIYIIFLLQINTVYRLVTYKQLKYISHSYGGWKSGSPRSRQRQIQCLVRAPFPNSWVMSSSCPHAVGGTSQLTGSL